MAIVERWLSIVKQVVQLKGILELKFWRERGSWEILLLNGQSFFETKKGNGALDRT